MHRLHHTAVTVVSTFLMLIASAQCPAEPSRTVPARRYEEGAVLLKLRTGRQKEFLRPMMAGQGLTIKKEYSFLSAWRGQEYLLLGSNRLSTNELMDLLVSHPSVEYCQPNYLGHPDAIPDDARFSELWGLCNTGQVVNHEAGTAGADVDALAAWDITAGAGDIVVAVTDTGVDYTHPDLAANMWHNPGEIPSNGLDDDGNGYIDDYYGYRFVEPESGNPMPDNGDWRFHGTHVAGTIAAVGNNGIGVAGVSWNTKIMALNVGQIMSLADVVQAFEYAAMMKTIYGVNIVAVNASFGVDDDEYAADNRILNDAVESLNEAGIVLCASAGNDSENTDVLTHYPSCLENTNVISVAATDQDDNLAAFSSYGPENVDLGAPGVNILSTVPGGYDYSDGTSMAAPHVAGAVALLAAIHPAESALDRIIRLLTSVDTLPSLTGKTVSGGRLNLVNALTGSGGPFILKARLKPGYPTQSILLEGAHFGTAQGEGGVIFRSAGGQEFAGSVSAWSEDRVVASVSDQTGIYASVRRADGTTSIAKRVSAWTRKRSSTYARQHAGAAVCGGKIYVFGDTAEMYDPETDAWSAIAQLPVPRTYLGVAELDGKIYCAGGRSNVTNISRVDVYDPVTDTYETKNSLPVSSWFALVNVQGTLYGLGYSNYHLYRYDPPADTWQDLGRLADWVTRECGVAVLGEKIYAFGGFITDIAQAYDTATGAWTTLAKMPLAMYNVSAVSDGKYIYVIGGDQTYYTSNPQIQQICLIYDPAADTWTSSSSGLFTPLAKKAGASAVLVPGYGIYSCNGYDRFDSGSQSVAIKQIEMFDPLDPVRTDVSAYDFGSTLVGNQSQARTFVVFNRSLADLTLGALSKTGADAADFIISADSVSGTVLAPGSRSTFTAYFAPAASGQKTVSVNVATSDPDFPGLTITLAGTGCRTGDLNYDGTKNVLDLVLCLRMILELDSPNLVMGDLDGNDSLDVSDLILLLQDALGGP